MMPPLLVRDIPLLNVPVCRVSDTCGEAIERIYAADPLKCCPLAVVAVDHTERAVGWVAWQMLLGYPSTCPVAEVLDYAIPSAYPETPAQAAAQTMRARDLKYLFVFMEGDPPRPFAVVALDALEQRLRTMPTGTGPLLRGTGPLRQTGPLRSPPPTTPPKPNGA